jgi:hypothetical protein
LLPGFLVGRAAAGERCLGRLSGLIVFAAGGRYGSTVVAWSHSSTVQVGFALSQSSHVHTLCACLLAGLAGRGSAGLQVFQPAISSLDSRVVQQTITTTTRISHVAILSPRLDQTTNLAQNKRTQPAHQAGHVFARLEPAPAFCTTRHARMAVCRPHTCTVRVAVDTTLWIPTKVPPAGSEKFFLPSHRPSPSTKKILSRVLPWRLTLIGSVQSGR